MIRGLLLLLFLLLGTTSCLENDRDRNAVQAAIQQGVNRKMADYQRIRKKRCMEGILEEANEIVDSILFVEARMAKDSLARPLRPNKPEKPTIKTILDTLPIAPILTPEQVDSLRSERQGKG